MTSRRQDTKGWFADYDQHFGLKGDDTGQDEACFIMRALGLRKGQAVLDVPCGAGRVAFHLARAGPNVTGIDLTASYLARGRKRFARAKLTGAFVQCDMRDVDFDGQFDAAFNWQGSFGYFEDEENLNVLCRLARALRAGGRLLIDQPNREYILRHFCSHDKHGSVRSTTRWNRRTQRIETSYTDTSDGRTWRLSMRLYTLGQFRQLFALVGLEVEATYGSLDGSPYRRGSRRIYIVGRRK